MFAISRLAEEDLERRGYVEERRVERERKHLEMQAQLMELENRMAADGCDGVDGRVDGGERKEEEEEEEEEKKSFEDAAAEMEREKSNEPAALAPPTSSREDGLLLACLLAFRVYDGYQRQNNLTRDTLQRFLSDIHGEESYKQPSVRTVLDKLLSQVIPGERGQEERRRMRHVIDPDIFQKGVHDTVVFLPAPVSFRSVAAPASRGDDDGSVEVSTIRQQSSTIAAMIMTKMIRKHHGMLKCQIVWQLLIWAKVV